MRSELRDAAAVRVHDEDVEIPVAVTLKGDLACPAVRRGLTELRCIALRREGLVGFATAGEKHAEGEARRTARSESHIASWHEPSKQEPAKRLARSAGFAICSPRGMGDPHDSAPRGSWHLSCVRICVCDRGAARSPTTSQIALFGGGETPRAPCSLNP